MKKETIFRHEINESMAASAAMSCLKNRNNHKQLNETSEFDNRFALRKDLKGMANDVTKKAYMIIRKQYGDNMWRQLGMDDGDEKGLISQINDYQKYYGMTDPQEIVNRMLGRKTQEQEEYESAQDQEVLQNNLADAWDEGINDDEVFEPYENKFDETHDDIVWKLISAVWHYFDNEPDVEGFNLYECTENQIGKAIEQILDKYGDFPDSNNFDKCYAWVKKHAEEIIKVLETGSLENSYEGHPEFAFSEQEELPQMERRDMILALSEYMSESWIDTGDDGDLDDIYYAIADILDKTGDYPASTDWKDCKPWCQKHYKEVEARIY